MSEIKLIYQDCYKCGASLKWYEANKAIADKHGINIVPLAFYLPLSANLIRQAAQKDVGLPFFTDGTRFAKSVSAFIPKTKTKTAKKVNPDGDTTED